MKTKEEIRQELGRRLLLGEMMARNARKFPNKEALVYGDTRLNYKQFNARINRLGHALMPAAVLLCFVGPAAADLFSADLKGQPVKGPGAPAARIPEKERTAEKARPETLSPQDELARLSGLTKKEARPKPQPVPPPTSAGERFELTGKLEDKLNQTIKELLWEIVPPLAEKIIKEEIDKIKSELSDSGL